MSARLFMWLMLLGFVVGFWLRPEFIVVLALGGLLCLLFAWLVREPDHPGYAATEEEILQVEREAEEY